MFIKWWITSTVSKNFEFQGARQAIRKESKHSIIFGSFFASCDPQFSLSSYMAKGNRKKVVCYGLIFVQNRNILGLVQTPNFSWAEPHSNQGRPKLFRPAELIQMPTLIPAELNSKEEKHSFRSTTYKRRYNNLCIWFGTWKVRRLNQSRSKVEIPCRARREERLSRSKLK